MKKKVAASKDLLVSPTRTSFGIEFLFSQGVLKFTGHSYPENSVEFFQPLLNWVKDLTSFPGKKIRVELRVKYFNTSTSKYLFQIMELLQAYHAKGNELDIIWFSSGNDDDMLDSWREIMHELDLGFGIEHE